jgi:hypothetical protein
VAFPGQRGPDHFLKAVVGRLPTQDVTDAVGAGDKGGGITGPARGIGDRQGIADHLFDRTQDLADGEATAVSAVHQQVAAVGNQMTERQDMGVGQIGNVDIVADAGTVRGRIIGAVDGNPIPQAESRLNRDLDQVGRRRGVLCRTPWLIQVSIRPRLFWVLLV